MRQFRLIATTFCLITVLVISLISCELVYEQPEKPEYYLLVISLDYKVWTELPLSRKQLNGTIRDAKEFAKAIEELTDRYNAALHTHMLLQESVNANPLASDYPTIQNIKNKLTEINSAIKDTDILIVYYSGHGADGSGDLIVDPTNYPNNLAIYPIDSLVDDIKAVKGSKVLIMDSCFSGNSVDEYPDTEDNIIQLRQSYDPSLFVLSASTKNQESEEVSFPSYSNHNHGYFTYSLLEALGWNHHYTEEVTTDDIITTVAGTIEDAMPASDNGKITIRSLFESTRKILFKLDFGTQLPQSGDGPIDMVLFSY